MSQKTLHDFQDYDCPDCDKSFETKRGLDVHHGRMHDGDLNKINVECANCGNSIQRHGRYIEKYDKFYCSDECQSDAKEGEEPPNKNREVRECDYCSQSFEVTKNRDKRFCSQTCYHSWNKETGARAGENNPQYKEKLTLECDWCGEDYKVHPVHSGSNFCSLECHNDHKRSITGSDHPLHKGGYDYYVAIRRGLSDVGWETLRKRHNGDECEMCGAKTSPNGRDLSMHHIVPILSGGDNGGYNFLTLCEPCHSKAEAYCSNLPGFEPVLVE